MWNSAEDFDFGDEDDVGALLAKARIGLAPNAHANQGRDNSGHTIGGALQQNIRQGAEETQDFGNRIGARVPTVSSSRISIKQRAASSQSSDDHTFTFEAPVPSSRGQPLANVTNSILTEERSQTAAPTQNVEAAPCLLKTGRFANAFKVPFLKGGNSHEKQGAIEASRLFIPPNGAPCDSTPARQASNASASTSGSERSAPRRRFDAAEKGKRVLSEFENSQGRVSLEPDAVVGVTKQSCPKQTVIPGPAGAVQRALAQGRSAAEAQNASTRKQPPLPLAALPDEDFSKGPWLAAVEFLRREELTRGALEMTQLRDLRKGAVSKRTAHLVVIVKSMTPTGEGDVFATVKDVTGTLGGTLHRKLLADKQLGPISAGTVLVLQQVAIFRPVPRTCYLNIMASNVLKVFPTKTPIPAVRSSLRAATDSTLVEPSWDGFPQAPSTGNGSKTFAGLSDPSRFLESGVAHDSGERRDGARGAESIKFGDAPEREPRLEDQSPELPSLSPSVSGGFGDSDIGLGRSEERTQTGSRLPFGYISGCAEPVANRPLVSSNGPTPRVNSTAQSSKSDTGRQVPAGLSCHPPVSFAAGGAPPEGGVSTTKRGRDGNAWDALEPSKATAGTVRGPGALNVDIQQLLAGLDEEDWFLPGEEAPPPSKKTRELEESLPFL